MANVMLNQLEHHCYYNPVDMQHISDEADEVTSHPIELVPSLSGAAADREIVDIDTLEQKAVDGYTSFVVGGLVTLSKRYVPILPSAMSDVRIARSE